MKHYLVCLSLFVLSLGCGVSFVYRFIQQYRWEQGLASVEKRLDELAYIFQEKTKAEDKAKKGDPSYLQTTIPSIPLLNLERGSLELLQKRKDLSEEEKRRLHFITQENLLSFRSGKKLALEPSQGMAFHEVEEKLERTVQIDEYDLQKLLSALENTSQASLRIKRLHLERHSISPIYNLYLELWRKE